MNIKSILALGFCIGNSDVCCNYIVNSKFPGNKSSDRKSGEIVTNRINKAASLEP